jgi:hypothetical protein
MNRIIRASAVSGTATVALLFIVVAARNSDPIDMSWDFLFGVLVAAVFLWIGGALLAAVALIPLKPFADRSSPWLSLPAFLVIGFSVPALLAYQWLQIGQHGSPPPLETERWFDLSLTIVSAGFVGLGSALASWLSIRRSARSTATTNGADDA